MNKAGREQLTVDKAAFRIASGQVFSLPRPFVHDSILYSVVNANKHRSFNEIEEGFLLSDGQFATREEAGRVALKAGQCQRLNNPPFLYIDPDLAHAWHKP